MSESLVIEPIAAPRDEAAEPLPVVPWVKEGDHSFLDARPTFDIADDKTAAKGWVAVTKENILLHVVVKDRFHINKKSGGAIWDGDALQLGIDAYGDGVGSLPKDMPMVGPDDAAIAVALTERGPEAFAYYHGRTQGEGPMNIHPAIVRDEQAKTTTYDIALPWKEFSAVPGISPTIGLSVQVNDSDEGPTQNRIYWGGGAAGKPRPGLFNRLALGTPPEEILSAAAMQTQIWRASQCGEIVVAVASDREFTLEAQFGGQARQFRVPAGSLAQGWRRFVVRGYPQTLPEKPQTMSATLKTASGAVVAASSAEIVAPGRIVRQFQARIAELVKGSPNALVTRHLRSVEGMVMEEWARDEAMLESTSEMARESVGLLQNLVANLTDDVADWDMYLARKRRLVLTFISSVDRSMQPYRLLLPQNWSPGKKYPMVVYLHGMGDPHPLHFVDGGAERGVDEATHKGGLQVLDAASPEAYVLDPFGRGNSGYVGIGDTDVFEAMEDVKKSFQVDEDRVYLTGFSMGGGGTWQLGLRAPQAWAAIAICAGGTWHLKTGQGLGANAAEVPVRIWHGDQDGAVSVQEAYAMQKELEAFGNKPEMVIIPGLGHDFSAASRDETFRWLLGHTRKSITQFTFVADTDEHPGRNGVVAVRDLTLSGLPKVTCRIEGQTVYIDSQGSAGLKVDLGEKGLGLQGQVIVLWNGQAAYEGAAKAITLGNVR